MPPPTKTVLPNAPDAYGVVHIVRASAIVRWRICMCPMLSGESATASHEWRSLSRAPIPLAEECIEPLTELSRPGEIDCDTHLRLRTLRASGREHHPFVGIAGLH